MALDLERVFKIRFFNIPHEPTHGLYVSATLTSKHIQSCSLPVGCSIFNWPDNLGIQTLIAEAACKHKHPNNTP